jgi:prolyl-tRNA editing enzyme YbaK/EbsC (Cys-tRNA(Pro) deacylase)
MTIFQHETIWAAAGTPNAVFQLTPEGLARLTGGRRSRIAQDEAETRP